MLVFKGIFMGGDIWELVFLLRMCIQVLCVLVFGLKGGNLELGSIRLCIDCVWSQVYKELGFGLEYRSFQGVLELEGERCE